MDASRRKWKAFGVKISLMPKRKQFLDSKLEAFKVKKDVLCNSADNRQQYQQPVLGVFVYKWVDGKNG